jgi:hypothetical protein
MGSKYFKKNAAIKIIPKIRKGTIAKDVLFEDDMVFSKGITV